MVEWSAAGKVSMMQRTDPRGAAVWVESEGRVSFAYSRQLECHAVHTSRYRLLYIL